MRSAQSVIQTALQIMVKIEHSACRGRSDYQLVFHCVISKLLGEYQRVQNAPVVLKELTDLRSGRIKYSQNVRRCLRQNPNDVRVCGPLWVHLEQERAC